MVPSPGIDTGAPARRYFQLPLNEMVSLDVTEAEAESNDVRKKIRNDKPDIYIFLG